MNLLKRQIAALDATIKDKWEPRARGERGDNVCACCLQFRKDGCIRCPIAEDGHPFCENTPFWNWEGIKDTDNAQAELNYLVDLRDRLKSSI